MSKASVNDLLETFEGGPRIEGEFGTEMQLEIDGVASRLRTQLVGVDSERILIVKTPTMSQIGGINVKLFAGNRVVVRYVFQGAVYGFETAIVEAITSPMRLLFLAYPKVVTTRNIRSNPRVNTSLPAKLRAGEAGADGTVTDISISGCQLEIRKDSLPPSVRLDVDSEVELTLQLPGVAGDLQIRGKLRSLRTVERKHEAGISFNELEEQVQLAIDSYVKLAD
jgi:c-di-GMP-binding flagellar brake protein YcgR